MLVPIGIFGGPMRWASAGIRLAMCGVAHALPFAVLAPAAATTAAPVPGAPVPATAVRRLIAIAANYARVHGGTRPRWVSAVTTTHAKALASTPPDESGRGEKDPTVYRVTMKGNFTGHDGPVGNGAAKPTGSYLSIVIDAHTFSVLDWRLSHEPPKVAPAMLGPVTYARAGECRSADVPQAGPLTSTMFLPPVMTVTFDVHRHHAAPLV